MNSQDQSQLIWISNEWLRSIWALFGWFLRTLAPPIISNRTDPSILPSVPFISKFWMPWSTHPKWSQPSIGYHGWTPTTVTAHRCCSKTAPSFQQNDNYTLSHFHVPKVNYSLPCVHDSSLIIHRRLTSAKTLLSIFLSRRKWPSPVKPQNLIHQ